MKDRIAKYPGRVTLEPVSGQANTYDMQRADQPIEPGTPLNKGNLLSDKTAAALGLGEGATPDEALLALANTNLDSAALYYVSATTHAGFVNQSSVNNGVVPLADDKYIYVLSNGARLSILDKKTLNLIKTSDIGGNSIAQDNDFVYLGGSSKIIKFSKSSLSVVATSALLGTYAYSVPIMQQYGDFIFCKTSNGEVYKVRKSDLLEMKGVYAASANSDYSAIDDEYIYFPENKYVRKLRQSDLSDVANPPIQIDTPFVVTDKNYYIFYSNSSTSSGYSKKIDKKTGQETETFLGGFAFNNIFFDGNYFYGIARVYDGNYKAFSIVKVSETNLSDVQLSPAISPGTCFWGDNDNIYSLYRSEAAIHKYDKIRLER